MKKKFFLCVVLLSVVVFAISIAWRARPIMGKKESYNAFFPKEKFLERIASPLPDWIARQLESDFQGTRPITAERVETAYQTIVKRVSEECCSHYRIIDNQLYKHSERKGYIASRDSFLEKAFKTLLSHIRVPDVDFILIPMDGIPEKHMPADFYLTEDPEDQVPVLGNAKLKEPKTHSVVLIPNLVVLSESWFNMAQEILSIRGQTPWTEKKERAFWRGGTSDVSLLERNKKDFVPTPRWNLCRISQKIPHIIDARFYTADTPILMQVAREENLLSSFVSKREHLEYKYLPDLDGHMCSSPGLMWKLLSDSLTLKQESEQIQWFHGAIAPYVHYLPIANDMSDLAQKIQWAQTHEQEVLKMIQNAQDFISHHLMYEDCYRYLYLVLQKYSSYQTIDFRELKRQMSKDPHWVNIHYRKRAHFYKLISRKFHQIFRMRDS